MVIRRGHHDCNLHLQLPMQSVPITAQVVSSNPVHGKVYLIHNVIKFFSDWRQVGGFLQVYPTNKTDRHDIIETLLKVR